MKESFHDWRKKPLLNITKDMIAKRHVIRGEASEARANLAMRFLRALFNFAAGEYEDAKDNRLFWKIQLNVYLILVRGIESKEDKLSLKRTNCQHGTKLLWNFKMNVAPANLPSCEIISY